MPPRSPAVRFARCSKEALRRAARRHLLRVALSALSLRLERALRAHRRAIPADQGPRDELYDLQRDHGERTNVADDRPQARQAMRAALDRILTRARIDKPSAVSDEQREQLQALGYVGAQALRRAGRAGRDAARPQGQSAGARALPARRGAGRRTEIRRRRHAASGHPRRKPRDG